MDTMVTPRYIAEAINDTVAGRRRLNASPTGIVLYRYEDVQFAAMPMWEWEDGHGAGKLEVVCREFPVVAVTRCGYRIIEHCDTRWVSKTSRKRFAHDTLDGAWDSYQYRKSRQIAVLSAQLDRARRAKALPRPTPRGCASW